MYPHVVQFESRRQELEREYPALEHRQAAARSKPRAAGSPRRYKLALLTWAGAYALITAILAVLGPVMGSWPLALRTLVLSVLMVAVLTWVVMPRLTRLFRGWLAA